MSVPVGVIFIRKIIHSSKIVTKIIFKDRVTYDRKIEGQTETIVYDAEIIDLKRVIKLYTFQLVTN